MPRYKVNKVTTRYEITKEKTAWEKFKTDLRNFTIVFVIVGVLVLIANN